MDNVNSITNNYQKQEVNDFIDYAIKKIEQNILTIKKQQEEIERLHEELEKYKKLEYNLNFATFNNEKICNEMKEMAKKEASLIVSEAKNNANKIINDALIRAEKLELQKREININIKDLKTKIRNVLVEELNKIEEIEFL